MPDPYARPKRKPKAIIKADVPYKPEAIKALGLDADEWGRPLTAERVKERVSERAAELADKGVRTLDEMSKREGLDRASIQAALSKRRATKELDKLT